MDQPDLRSSEHYINREQYKTAMDTPLVLGTFKEEAPKIQGRVEMAPVIFEYLRDALGAVVAEGTGKLARIPGVAIGGKTGTAQTHEFKSDAERKRRDQDHAWFAGFAPLEEPQVVVVVFAEKAGLGGQVAAPIAREIFKAVFLEKVARVDPTR